MPDVVVDNSVVAKWYLAETYSSEARSLLDIEFGLHAPELLIAELANVLWRKTSTGVLTGEEAIELTSHLLRQDLELHPLAPLMESAVQLAVAANHPAYDCFYLALALRLDGPCVTADRRFYDSFAARYPETMVWIEDLL